MLSDSTNTENGGKSQGRGRSNSLPAHVVDYLKAWLMSPDHIHHPYPTDKQKAKMVADTGIELKRLNNWFVNNRIRYWKPRMEALQRQKQRIQAHREDGAAPIFLQLGAPCTSTSGNQLRRLQTLLPSSPSTVHTVSDASSSLNESSVSTDDGNLSDGSSIRSGDEETVLHRNQSSKKALLLARINRKRPCPTVELLSPRSKYSRKNADVWRSACVDSPRIYDGTLPTLDEAARLFGYAEDQ